MIRSGSAAALALLSVGCARAALTTREAHLATLREIARTCGLPESTFRLVGADELRLRPPKDASYTSVDCALTALKKTDLPQSMGFVGNEAPEEGQ